MIKSYPKLGHQVMKCGGRLDVGEDMGGDDIRESVNDMDSDDFRETEELAEASRKLPNEARESHDVHMMSIQRNRRRTGRYANERASRQLVVRRAANLPAAERALVEAHYDRGVSVRELALIHQVKPRRLRWRLNALRDAMLDPCFPLAVEFGQRLPRQLQTTAREHFLCGRVMREIATDHRKTLHQVRKEIDLSRSLLVMMLAGQQEVPTELAARTLLGRVA